MKTCQVGKRRTDIPMYPKTWGYWKLQREVFTLQKRLAYNSTKSIELLYSTIAENILAFDSILEFIITAESPQSEQRILDFVVENFDVNWTAYAQVNFRLLWLMNLGKVEKTEEGLYQHKT